MSNRVNHPSHYQGANGIETIDVIRHYVCDIANALKYLMRAGHKPERGMTDEEKEVEDLKKALWYIDDYRIRIPQLLMSHFKSPERMERIVAEVTGWSVDQIACGQKDNMMFVAVRGLLTVGIVRRGEVRVSYHWEQVISDAKEAIRQRILAIEDAMTQKELDSTLQALHGQAIDGEDYISKPACRRPTEPEHYDPLNIIIQQGTAYCLASEPKKKPNGALYSPCDLCALRYDCISDGGTEPLRSLCQLHQATDQEYYREVGRAQYAPAFGTIEVVDEMKELELEKKRLEEEDEDEE